MVSFVHNPYSNENASSQWKNYVQDKAFHDDFKDAIKPKVYRHCSNTGEARGLFVSRAGPATNRASEWLNLVEGRRGSDRF